jgi:hypothetical protein
MSLIIGSAYAEPVGEVLIGPIDYFQDVNGVKVDITAKTYLKLTTVDNRVDVKLRVLGDLFDLQRKIGEIVDTFRLPRENCHSFSPNNPVVDIPRKELRANVDGATFSIGGTVTMWECLENPVPNSKVDWEIRKIGLGIKTKVPVVHTWPGNPIKTILATQPFDADLPLNIVKSNDHSVGVEFSKPDIELKGQYAFITKGVLKIAGVDVNQKAYEALQKAIDPSKLLLTIPTELSKYNPSVESAKLFNDAGAPHCRNRPGCVGPGFGFDGLTARLSH